MARKTTESIRVPKPLKARLEAIAEEVESKSDRRPTQPEILEVMESYTKREILVRALVELCSAPTEEDRQSALMRAKRGKR